MANWTTLFASPADCECNDCNSVFSPAAYLVDIMQYLDHCDSNGTGSKSVLQVLFERRPDIGNLLLTCENTNTEIPYIDLVNEIMEYYVAHSQNNAIPFNAGDTGNATAEELKAEPQYILLDAYKQVYQKVYPFNLPYHQPLDVIRAYLKFLKTSRAELMEVFGKNPPNVTTNAIPQAAIDAEWMQSSLNEYLVLTNTSLNFSGQAVSGYPLALSTYYGGIDLSEIGIPVSGKSVSGNPGILAITGLQYTDLLAILETKFINPGQDAWNVLQNLLVKSPTIQSIDFYKSLQSDYTSLKVDSTKDLSQATTQIINNAGITSPEEVKKFKDWLLDNFILFQQTITIYECTLNQDGQCTSACNIDNMLLHSVQWLYEKGITEGFSQATSNSTDGSKEGFSYSGAEANIKELDSTPQYPNKPGFLSRFHRFIRLWRKTGWSIHELDNMIVAFSNPDDVDINTALIQDLAFVIKVNAILNLPLIQLACLWGDIDTHGDHSVNFPKSMSLYAQLFLTPTGNVTTSGTATVSIFAISPLNQYLDLSSSSPVPQIADHLPEIFAALSISADDYNAIIADAPFLDNNVSVHNLSLLYKYKLLADALDISVEDLCTLKSNCFNVDPFSSPDNTFEFIQNVQKFQDAQTTQTSLTVPLLNYILSGSSKPIDNIALSQDTIFNVLPGLRSALLKIDNDNPVSDVNSITTDLLSKKLMLLYSKDIANQFVQMLSALSVAVPDQSYTIPADSKYSYNITVAYASLNGQFQLNETVTDSNGSTGTVTNISDTQLTLTNVKFNLPNNSLVGTITGQISNAVVTVVNFTILFQLTGFITYDEYNKIISSAGLSKGFKAAINTLYQESLTAINQANIITAPQAVSLSPQQPNTNSIPANLSQKYSFSQSGTSWFLQCKGIMSDVEYNQLKNQGNVPLTSAVNYIYNYPSIFLQNNFPGLYNSGNINTALQNFFGLSGNPINDLTGKLTYFYNLFLPFLIAELKHIQTISWISALVGLDGKSVSTITNSDLDTLIQAASKTGLDANYFNIPVLATDPTIIIDNEINDSWGKTSPVASADFSVKWKGWLSPATDGDYIFTLITADTSDQVNLLVNGLQTAINTGVPLIGGQLYSIELDYTHASGNAGVQLFWQSATMPQSIIDTQYLYPGTNVQTVLQKAILYHRAAQFINGFALSVTEVEYFFNNKADFNNLNFLNITNIQWLRIYNYTIIRKIIPANLLLTIFRSAFVEDASNPGLLPSDALISSIANANQPKWNKDYLSYLAGNLLTSLVNPAVKPINSYYGYKAASFKNEIALLQIKKAMDLAIKTKMPVNSSGLPAWTMIETDPATSIDLLHPFAEQIKNAVKAKYQDNWLTIATQLNNPIRENQKQALISYLLTLQLPAPDGIGSDGSGKVTDADGLFEYLLIDVQMTSAVVTSRLIQATLAVQLFADRCLLGLENTEVPLTSITINPDEWDWMKHYSVAAGLKKLFVYVENYLDPSLRDDKSPFFLDFESAIKKGDITDENVENAFRDYLYKLNEVSNMEQCGMYNDEDTKTMYVFARTHATPYNYYFRTASTITCTGDSWTWSPWEQVQLDIKSIDDGDNSGVHLMPVIWKKRLVLFWPEFTQKTVPSISSSASQTFQQISNSSPGDNSSQNYWEIRFAWSEYSNGKWSPKKLSKELFTPFLQLWQSYYQEENLELFLSNIQINSQIAILTQKGSSGKNNQSIDSLKSSLNKLYSLPQIPCKCFSFELIIDKTEQLQIEMSVNSDYIFEKLQIGALPLSVITLPDATSKLWVETPDLMEVFEEFDLIQTTEDNDYDDNSIDEDNYSVNYNSFFENYRFNEAELNFAGVNFLQQKIDHELLFSNNITLIGFKDNLNYPFFYSDIDNNRTYFATPLRVEFAIPVRPYPWTNPVTAPISIYNPNIHSKQNNPILSIKNVKALVTSASADKQTSEINSIPDNSFLNSPSKPLINNFNNATSNLYDIGQIVAKGTKHLQSDVTIDPGVFGGSITPIIACQKTGLAFYSFYHPFVSIFIKKLNQNGLPALLAANTAEFKEDAANNIIDQDTARKANDAGEIFKNTYNPNFITVQQYSFADPDRNYYLENVDFSLYGTYSSYNWELFFHAPFLIATSLSKNGKYAESRKWFHYIFNPLSTETPDPKNSNSPFWQVLPFKTAVDVEMTNFIESLKQGYDNSNTIDNWRNDPFNAFLIARARPVAFMKNVVMSYLDNLIAWGDDLFRTYIRENINEATQLYIMAAHILGAVPQYIPSRGIIPSASYNQLTSNLDDFGDAIVQLENAFPNSSDIEQTDNSVPQNLLGIGQTLYFCVPPNDKLLAYWTTVGDRLFKIRHGENIDGVFVPLALYQPPIDPALLLQAKAQGLDIAGILADLESPVPMYRFVYLLQKAKEFCNEVVSLGNAVLSANEKQDAEQLSRLRQTQEIAMLNLVTAIKTRQVLEAQANLDNLNSSRETALQRFQHYAVELLGNSQPSVPDAPSLPDDLDENSSLPGETIINQVTSSIDVSLTGTDESGVKVIPKEKQEMDDSELAYIAQQVTGNAQGLASILHMIPDISVHGTPLGVGVAAKIGGSNLGFAANAIAAVAQLVGTGYSHAASQASRMSGFIRREQDWVFQANMTAREIIQLDKQIIAAQIRQQMAQHELDNHNSQIQNAQDIETFLETKFSKQELYDWMLDQLQNVHKQGYQLAYDMARTAEKAYRFELGIQNTSFVQYGYYNDTYLGITAGEQLQLALNQMDSSYIENNVREFELVKHISIVQLDPLSLLELRETGSCQINMPEQLFDIDYPGHYFRRIKSVSISIPCVVGPYTTVNSTLRLQNNSLRINSLTNNSSENFIKNNIPFTAIATSSAQNDSGMFELNFRDERYLPFEGAGATSSWQLELNGKFLNSDDGTITDFSQFNYDTITDIIIHLKYTSREDAGDFKNWSINNLMTYKKGQNFTRLFSIRQEFPNEYYAFLNQPDSSGNQILALDLMSSRFPYFASLGVINMSEIEIFADINIQSSNDFSFSISSNNGTTTIDCTADSNYGSLLHGTLKNYSATISATQDLKLSITNNNSATQLNNQNLKELYLIFYYAIN